MGGPATPAKGWKAWGMRVGQSDLGAVAVRESRGVARTTTDYHSLHEEMMAIGT